jgi:hypothetical protein
MTLCPECLAPVVDRYDLPRIIETARLLGRAQAYLEIEQGKLERSRADARGGAFVVGSYDQQRLVEHRQAEVDKWTAELKALTP